MDKTWLKHTNTLAQGNTNTLGSTGTKLLTMYIGKENMRPKSQKIVIFMCDEHIFDDQM